MVGALTVCMQFNTWGPEYWHRLVTQKSPGEGDKDLWKFSAMAFGLDLHQVEQAPQRIGVSQRTDRYEMKTELTYVHSISAAVVRGTMSIPSVRIASTSKVSNGLTL